MRRLGLRRRRLGPRRFLGGGRLACFYRADQNMRVPAFEARHTFHTAERSQIPGEAHEEFLAEIRMGDFPPAELDYGLDAVAFLQEPDRMVFLEVVIVFIRVGAELEFFDLHDVLFLLSLVLFLFLLVLEVTEVYGLGDRRHRRRSHKNEIQAQFLRSA